MKQKITIFLFFSVFILVLSMAWYYSFADDNRHKERSGYQKISDRDDDDDDNGRHRNRNRQRQRDHRRSQSTLKPVNNITYEAECGACHFLYQPENGAFVEAQKAVPPTEAVQRGKYVRSKS